MSDDFFYWRKIKFVPLISDGGPLYDHWVSESGNWSLRQFTVTKTRQVYWVASWESDEDDRSINSDGRHGNRILALEALLPNLREHIQYCAEQAQKAEEKVVRYHREKEEIRKALEAVEGLEESE